jgi:poly-gamma-glutamate capsule biosynthesis protein CapA/YwtB (metallophosphatase superfamily)
MKRLISLVLLLLICIQVKSQTIRIKAVGDIMLGSTTPTKILPAGNGEIFGESIGSHLEGADITFGNLEGVFVNGEFKPQKCSEASRNAKRCYEFGMPQNLVQALTDMHFTVMSMDNNHNSDYGNAGVNFTKNLLKENGIKYAAKKSPIILEIDGKKIGIAAFGHSSISYRVSDLVTAKKVIEDLDKQCDIVLVSFHGGAEGLDAQHVKDETEEYYGENRGNLVQFSKTVIDAGADLVIGHGPHVLRGIDSYKDKLIIYSLGNFLTHGNVNIRDVRGNAAIMDIELDLATGDLISGQIIPTKQIGKGVAVYDESNKAIELIRGLSKTDFPNSKLSITSDGRITK